MRESDAPHAGVFIRRSAHDGGAALAACVTQRVRLRLFLVPRLALELSVTHAAFISQLLVGILPRQKLSVPDTPRGTQARTCRLERRVGSSICFRFLADLSTCVVSRFSLCRAAAATSDWNSPSASMICAGGPQTPQRGEAEGNSRCC